MSEKNNAETVVELVKKADGTPVASVIRLDDGRTMIARRNDMVLDTVTPANRAEVFMPKNVTQMPKLQTVQSMIDYVNRFKNPDTVLFANIDNNDVLAVIDYHGKPTGEVIEGRDDGTLPAPRLGSHRAALHLPFSQEWQLWNSVSNKLMSHRDFASFIEENAIDVIEPAGAALLEMCRDLHVINDSSFKSSIRHGDTEKFEYQKNTNATVRGDVEIPVSITLSIPVYFGEENVHVTAFMRRKIDEGVLSLGVKLSRVESIRQNEFHRIVGDIAGHTNDLTTVYGVPA